MVDVILQYEGTINEFIGDAILVIFGAPLWWPDHAQRAIACAVAMQLAMVSVNAQNQRDGLPEVEMGIGVNTGEVVVGNLGSHKRTKYGIVGTPVNLTARIESYTVGGQILISESTMYEVLVGSTISFCQRAKIPSSFCPRGYPSSIPF
jgi:adenylate cyclase